MASVSRIRRATVLCLVALCAVAGMARAEVGDYVPANAIAVLKVQQPVAQFDKFSDSALFMKIEDPAFIPDLAHVIQQIRQGVATLDTQLNVNIHQVMTDLLGRETAVVALPDNMIVGVVEGRDAKSLQHGVDEFLRIQRATGDLTAESTSAYKGVTIYSGMQKNGERYHAVSGNVLAVSSRIEAVQKVIDVIQGAPSLGGTDRYRQASAVVEGAPVTGYLNGDALQPIAQALMAPTAKADPGQEILRSRLADFLQRVAYGVLGVRADGALQVRLTFAYRGGNIPKALQAALPAPGTSMDILGLVPQPDVLAGARSLNVKGVWDYTVQAVSAVNPVAADKLQKGLEGVVGMIGGVNTPEQLFSELGDQVGIFILPPPDANGMPAGAIALQLRDTTHIPDTVASVVGMDVALANSKGWDMSIEAPKYRDVQLNTVRIKRQGPLGQLSPTYGVVNGYLILASTLDAAEKVVDAAKSGSAVTIDKPGTPVAVLNVSVPQVRALLTKYHDFIVRKSVAKEGKTKQKVESDLAALDKLLGLMNQVQIVTTYEPGRTNHFLTVQPAGGRP